MEDLMENCKRRSMKICLPRFQQEKLCQPVGDWEPQLGKLSITKPRNEFSSGVDVDKPGKEIGQTIYSFANQVSASCLLQKLFKATFQVSQRRTTMPFLVNYMFGTDCLVSLEIKFVIIAFEGCPKMDMKITPGDVNEEDGTEPVFNRCVTTHNLVTHGLRRILQAVLRETAVEST